MTVENVTIEVEANTDKARRSFDGLNTACLLYTSPSPRDRG